MVALQVPTIRPAAAAVSFIGSGVGPIVDGTAPPGTFGAARDVTFTVAGLTQNVGSLAVGFSFGPAHTFVGDLDVVLIAPGGSPTLPVFSRTGAVPGSEAGDGSDVAGPYNFADSATANWWTAAATTPNVPGDTIPSGTYRTTAAGPVASAPAAVTSLDATFGALTPAQANGTWTLRFRDGNSSDTGSVSAAHLTFANEPGKAVVDQDADHKTDFLIARGIAGDNIAWTWLTQTGAIVNDLFGKATTDFPEPGDYDGDGKTDIAVWREGPHGTWYVHRSSDAGTTALEWGTTGDDPSVIGDYDGDGKTDFAVFRKTTGIWWVLRSSDGVGSAVEWGGPSDYPAPGDYDGDGKNDFAVQRSINGSGYFFIKLSSGGERLMQFGFGGDVVAPGDYDGDGKTDIATVRNVGTTGSPFNFYSWGILRSSDNTAAGMNWGDPDTDDITQGDYDGDGKTDIAVSREASPRRWFVKKSSDGSLLDVFFGTADDYPVNTYNVH
jgi:hypothetical protein